MNLYIKEKNKAYKMYQKIRQVFCPYLKQKVIFNSKGFRHLIYKSGHIKRDEKTQLFRIKLLPLAYRLLQVTTTVQEEDFYRSSLEVKEHGKRLKRIKKIYYYGFIAIIDGWKIKVIVKKIGNGQYFFWSIIPTWMTNRKRDQGKRYLNFTGDMERD